VNAPSLPTSGTCLVTFDAGLGPRAGVLSGDRVVPIPGHRDVGSLLRAGVALDTLAPTHDGVAVDAVTLLRPILEPGAVFCLGLNFRTHIEELGMAIPTVPTLFSKLSRSLADPYASVAVPAASLCLDYEGELAVVIGTGGRDVAPADAWDHVAGLCVFNDISVRDYQRRSSQWFAGKTFQRSSPIGPALVSVDGAPDLADRELRVTVNGEERQHAWLGDLVFDVPTMVADLSRIVTLEPGDVIAMGTPGGVGIGATPERFLAPGDRVDVAITGLGTLSTTIAAGDGD
jgi:acylpyruvate hydrolase